MPFVPRNLPVVARAVLAAAGIAAAAEAFAAAPAAASMPAQQTARCAAASLTSSCPEPTAQTQQRRPTQCGPGLPPCPGN
jgi:hypothetical protein